MSLVKGNIAEIEFMLKATRMGLICSKPEIPYDYDFLVDNGSQIFRVQVKSNFQTGPSYKLNLGQGTKSKNAYNPKAIDIMACYLDEIKTWYIFPIKDIAQKITFRIFPNDIESPWNKYRGAWGLLLK